MNLNSQLPLGPGNSLQGLAGTAAVVTFTVVGTEETFVPQIRRAGVLAQGQLGSSNTLLYMPSPDGETDIAAIYLANTSASAVAGVTLSLGGSSATATFQFLPAITIPANGMAVFTGGVLRVYDASGNIQQTGTQAFDATVPALTTPAALGTTGTALTAPHRDHTHQSPGGIASIVAASAGINTVETRAVGASIPIGMLKAGTVLRIKAFCFITSTVDNLATFNLRLGPTTLTGNIPAALAAHCGNSGTVTAAGLLIDLLLTIRTAGASGTCYGVGSALSLSSGAAVTQALDDANQLFTPASVAVDTTVVNVVELTCVTAGSTTTVTFQVGVIEIVKM